MSFHDWGTSWLLAQLKPNSGHIAERNLKLQGFRTFLPTEEVTKRARGQFVTALRPLFPGYIFVALNADADHWRAINSTQGITRLVSFGNEPAIVPPEVVGHLMRRCDTSGSLMPHASLQAGDHVQLNSGPFAGFVGTIEEIAPDRRVWVLMGFKSRVSVSADQLQKA